MGRAPRISRIDVADAKAAAEHGDEYRRCLIGERPKPTREQIATYRRLWAMTHPHLEQPKSDYEAEFTLHMARTNAASAPLAHRQYSADWLRERGFGSFLPPELQPKERKRGTIILPHRQAQDHGTGRLPGLGG